MADSAYTDTFAADNLPPRELWPDLINLDKLGYPERLNCAVELLDTAVADGFGTYTAMIAEVSVNEAGDVKVHRVVIAVDSGYVVNPDTCRAQAESNVVYGLGSILYQQINVKEGRVVESNFHDFRLPKIDEMPKVETLLVPTGGFWGGNGEPAILTLAPAVCNAIFAATGKRVRSLPLKNQDLRSA